MPITLTWQAITLRLVLTILCAVPLRSPALAKYLASHRVLSLQRN
jgi:hypothetical protein